MDACDRCCQTSRVTWTKSGARLRFCHHHSHTLGPQLLAAGWSAKPIIDPDSDTRPGGPLPARST